jgi:folate-binding protein YgfZ
VSSQDASRGLATLALDSLHQRLGARFVEERGVAVPADYGDLAGEIAGLRDSHAVVDLSWATRLELRGRDRHRFLNGLVTSNVKDLRAGQGRYGFFLNKQGRVIADVYTTALDDRLWLELPADCGEPMRRHIESYRVIDDVEVAGLDDMALIGVLGPAAAAVLGDAAAALALDASVRAAIEGCEVQLTRRRVFGVEGFVLWVPSSLAEDIFVALAAGGRAAGLGALDARRVAAGVARFGPDFGDETVANETGLVDQAIDFTKGCYLGQEIVARIFYKGKPSQPLMALEVNGRPVAPEPPCSIHPIAGSGAGETCGTVTSVTAGGEPGVWLAIGAVSRRALDDGTALALDGGGEVRIRERAELASQTGAS